MRALSLWNNDFWSPAGRFDELDRELRQAHLPALEPSCDIFETKEDYKVVIDLPGLKKEEVSIEVHEDRLTVSGERKWEASKDEEARHWIGRGYGRFSRSFTLPSVADGEKSEAKFENGVLTVRIPKLEVTKPKQIRVA